MAEVRLYPFEGNKVKINFHSESIKAFFKRETELWLSSLALLFTEKLFCRAPCLPPKASTIFYIIASGGVLRLDLICCHKGTFSTNTNVARLKVVSNMFCVFAEYALDTQNCASSTFLQLCH